MAKNNAALFTDEFIQEHSGFDSLDELFAYGKLSIEDVNQNEIDAFIATNTSFSSWDEMKMVGAHYVAAQALNKKEKP